MSVNYETRVVRGWKVPAELQDIINDLTEYKYEDDFHRCNAYTDNPGYFIFGEELCSIPCGTSLSLEDILYDIDCPFSLDIDAIRCAVASNIECYGYIQDSPSIYVMCCVM